jgi:hypothetical protein
MKIEKSVDSYPLVYQFEPNRPDHLPEIVMKSAVKNKRKSEIVLNNGKM